MQYSKYGLLIATKVLAASPAELVNCGDYERDNCWHCIFNSENQYIGQSGCSGDCVWDDSLYGECVTDTWYACGNNATVRQCRSCVLEEHGCDGGGDCESIIDDDINDISGAGECYPILTNDGAAPEVSLYFRLVEPEVGDRPEGRPSETSEPGPSREVVRPEAPRPSWVYTTLTVQNTTDETYFGALNFGSSRPQFDFLSIGELGINHISSNPARGQLKFVTKDPLCKLYPSVCGENPAMMMPAILACGTNVVCGVHINERGEEEGTEAIFESPDIPMENEPYHFALQVVPVIDSSTLAFADRIQLTAYVWAGHLGSWKMLSRVEISFYYDPTTSWDSWWIREAYASVIQTKKINALSLRSAVIGPLLFSGTDEYGQDAATASIYGLKEGYFLSDFFRGGNPKYLGAYQHDESGGVAIEIGGRIKKNNTVHKHGAISMSPMSISNVDSLNVIADKRACLASSFSRRQIESCFRRQSGKKGDSGSRDGSPLALNVQDGYSPPGGKWLSKRIPDWFPDFGIF